MSVDPYKTLGVARTATAAEIKKAYRKLARSSHPDLHPDDKAAEARFTAISAAYDLLKDPETRACYDAGEIDAQGSERPRRQYYRDYAKTGQGAYQGRPSGTRDASYSDIFADILRRHAAGGFDFGGRTTPVAGADVTYKLTVPFLDAVRGIETALTLSDGASLSVKIPAGTQDGQTLRLRGKGTPGTGGGAAGDALITVTVQPHPEFRREGDDILLTLTLPFEDAILGGKVTVPTIHGSVELTVPPGTSSGRVFRLRGRGVKHMGGQEAGDQRVEVKVSVPKAPDEPLRSFLTEWREKRPSGTRSDAKGGAAS
jgi:DnaJ-class molecular chaperone